MIGFKKLSKYLIYSVILIFITVLLYTLILPKYKNAFIINNIKVKVTKSSLYHNCLNSDSSIVIVIKFTKEYISTSSAQRDLFLVADSKERGLEGLLNDDFEINFSIKKDTSHIGINSYIKPTDSCSINYKMLGKDLSHLYEFKPDINQFINDIKLNKKYTRGECLDNKDLYFKLFLPKNLKINPNDQILVETISNKIKQKRIFNYP